LDIKYSYKIRLKLTVLVHIVLSPQQLRFENKQQIVIAKGAFQAFIKNACTFPSDGQT